MVIWLIGLSGAGKSTIGRHVYRLLKERAPNTVLVDGDEVRRIFKKEGADKDYSAAARRENAERIAEICAWLDRQEINVVCCILSIFEETRRWNRDSYRGYYEVYVSTPMEVLLRRDYKGLYRGALAGTVKDVVGFDIPFLPPEAPDLVLDNSADDADHEEMARTILRGAGVPL